MSKRRKKAWDHDRVFDAMVAKGLEVRKTQNNYYVRLYPQSHNCAILYKRGGTFNTRPLHLQPGSTSWIPQEFKRLVPVIERIYLGRSADKSDGQQRWIVCTVDWTRLAQAFRLKLPKT